MTLIELYNLKLNEYKETGLRERPWKLLAMLLLSEKDKYEPLINSQEKFYKKYKKEIDKKISKVERDFNFTHEDIVEYIEKPMDFFERICYELTVEERLFILEILENKSCMNCANGSCRVEYSEKIGVDEFGNPQGSKCIGWFNAELIGRSKVLRKTDINKLR